MSEEQSTHNILPKLIGGGVLLLIGGFIVLSLRKRHPDEQLINYLKIKIKKSFVNAEENLCPLQSSKTKLISDDKITIALNLVSNLKKKEKSTQSTNKPFSPPFQKGLLISELPQKNPTHRLLYNKFYFMKNHLLVVTHQREEQTVKLNKQDFKQTVLVMYAINGSFFFNCGPQSGYSQNHKHIQILPEESLSLPIISKLITIIDQDQSEELNLLNFKGSKIYLYKGYQFIHGIIKIEENVELQKMAQAFEDAYNQLKSHLNIILNNNDFSYNLIGCKNFIIMIPRRKQKLFDKIGVNGVGFMGSIILKDQVLLNEIEYLLKPTNILRQLTFTQIPNQ